MGRPRKNLLVADAMRDPDDPEIDVTEDEANAAAEIVEPPAAPVVAVSSAAVTLTFDQMKELMGLSGQNAAEMMARAMEAQSKTNAEAAARVRNPIPEGTDASNPRISVFNPLGDRDHPRPLLKCQFFLGTSEGKNGEIKRSYPFLDDDLTVHEVIALNTLQPATTTIELYDGTKVPLSIVADQHPVTGNLQRMVFVLPATVTGKGSQLKNMLPSPAKIVAQITGHDYTALSAEDLAWFMAEHREKRYVSVREPVAA